MDQMLTKYTTKRRTNRWSLSFFYNMIDIMALASYIIYDENMCVKNKEGARRNFLCQLSEQLVYPSVQERSKNKHVTSNFVSRSGIKAFLNEKIKVRRIKFKYVNVTK